MKQFRKKDIELIEELNGLPYEGFVYFMGSYQYGFVKIGYSKNPLFRLKVLQTGCPFKLKLFFVINGNERLEKELHDRFSKYNTWGEWFKVKGRLSSYILDKMNLEMNPRKQSLRDRRSKTKNELDNQFNQMFNKWG